MSWIEEINYGKADDRLKKMYDQAVGPGKPIDNILKVHSLRPHTLVGHMALYKNVLHHSQNTLPKWYLETLGVYVSYLNKCFYCVEHHFAGLKKAIGDEDKSQQIFESIVNDLPQSYFEGKFLEGLMYAKTLTLSIHNVNENDVQKLREEGFSDGEILEINQVVSYFNYANRTVLGLGVNLDGDVLGNSPESIGQ
jgi:uncharacterized peroxidase-related enzyme